MTELSKKINELTYDERNVLFSRLYFLGTNNNKSFDEKIELITLISYLTFKLQEKDPTTYHSSKVVLEKILPEPMQYELLIDHYSCFCDELLSGVKEFKNPGDYKSSKGLIERVKQLVEQWTPF